MRRPFDSVSFNILEPFETLLLSFSPKHAVAILQCKQSEIGEEAKPTFILELKNSVKGCLNSMQKLKFFAGSSAHEL